MILDYVTSKGYLYRSELEEWMYSQGMAKNKALAAYSGLVESGELAKITEHATNKVIVGTPSHILTMLRDDISGKYRREGIKCIS